MGQEFLRARMLAATSATTISGKRFSEGHPTRRGIAAAAVVFLLLMSPAIAFAGIKHWLGSYTQGTYGNQDNRIILFCIAVDGNFEF